MNYATLQYLANTTDAPKGGISSHPKNEVDRQAIINTIIQGMNKPPSQDMPTPGRRLAMGDVVKGPWSLPNAVNEGMGLARPIMPPMGAVPPGGGQIAKLPPPKEKPQWEVYARSQKADKTLGPYTREDAKRILEALKAKGNEAHGYLGTGRPIDDAEKYKRALYLQRFLAD